RANGNERFGRNENVTALGDLDISGTLVELSDLNALGSINVNASTIRLLARAAGNVKLAAIQGGGVDVDTGIDFVAGNSIIFSVAPTLVGGPAGATARFSTSTGGDVTFAGSTAIPFVVLQFTDAANAAAYASGGTIFDLLAGGISNANVSDALAGAVPQDDETREVEQSIGLDPGTRQVLQLLGINAVAPNNADLRNAAADGVMVQDDAPRVMASDDLTLRVSETRIPAVQANAIRDDYNRVFAAETGDGADGTVTGEQLIKTRLAEGYDAYFERLDETGDEASPAGFTAFLRETDPDLYGRLEAVNRMLGAIDELPLSTYEYDQARRKLVTQRLLPPVLGQRYDFFSDALDTVGR
ncbi:MAG: hypothetical protein KDA25_11890, partial [Phycisphaerales bacterium]|nr:hypothetical protein [Phycisphaerales bacterium]